MKIPKNRSGLPAAGFSFAFPPEVHRVVGNGWQLSVER
jgi:hypothetical protein